MSAMNYRIRPVVLHGHLCDGVWTDGTFAWVGTVQLYTLITGQQRELVLPLTNADGDYIPAPEDWQERIIEPLGVHVTPIVPRNVAPATYYRVLHS